MGLYAATICISVVRVGVDVFGNVTRTMGTSSSLRKRSRSDSRDPLDEGKEYIEVEYHFNSFGPTIAANAYLSTIKKYEG